MSPERGFSEYHPDWIRVVKITDSDTINALENAARDARRPPLSLVPRFILNKQRITEILQAIDRYNNADLPVPEEWVDELADLTWRERDRLKAIQGNSVSPEV